LPREIEAQHAAVLALRVEQVLALPDGVDVELVQLRKQSGFDVAMETSIVQARPIVHPSPRVLTPPPDAVLAPLQDGRVWTWDVAHNPDPLSVAQQGLVERVERAGIAPWSLRIVAGFLYSASRGEPAPALGSVDEVAKRAAELEGQLEKTLSVTEPTLTEAIERYLAFYAIWARELSPLITAARAVLPTALRARDLEHAAPLLIGQRASAVEATLLAAARGDLDEDDVVRQLGCLSPAWDVAAPTFGERPGLLRDAIARAAVVLAKPREIELKLPGYPRGLERELAEPIKFGRLAAELGERDDALFARAQLLVRKALLARGRELGIGDDVFWIALDEGAADRDELRRKASGARAAAERAGRWQMPIVVGGEPPVEATSLRGSGTGPRVSGRVVRFESLASAIAVGAGDVVVTRAMTPALAVLVAGCAALVSETGGLLDHGAALARELGVPCVVGCRDAWSQLGSGMLVTVDGDAGSVTIGHHAPSS
jgi:pyruvate,water dikinase